MESANYQRVAAVRGRGGGGAASKSEKRGPRGAQSGVWDGGRRAEEKKVALEDRVLRRFAKKNFASWKKVRTFATAFERDGSAAKAKKA